ncbi:LacI family transcriptional regulator [Ruania suaedae]|uniref:LacI family DNA-binding transcriptional regulator n=1 Tax=Ruania suaedae TaxID=2897774 RepID=UPI001E533720|nr:LacI family DNA-binding transcriptional regulator [Ruania suaedae]UFU02007.1 LacI family transcriptional regulator [Ruania suaedae]
MATMKDVAEHAGVSIATVSFVVNDTKPVSPATRERIEASMAELGYRRNAVARALASRRTRILALAYPMLERSPGTGSVEFFTSAAAAAAERDYHLVIWPVSTDGHELTTLAGQGLVDGVLLMEVRLQDERVRLLEQAGMPFALIGRTEIPDAHPHVDIDFQATVCAAVDHLVGLGHTRLGLLLHDDDGYGPDVRTRTAFTQMCADRGVQSHLVDAGEHTDPSDLARSVRHQSPDSTAILALGELAAMHLVAGMRRIGLAVPDHLSVLALCATTAGAGLCDPELTILRSPGPELGRLGAEALIRSLEGEPALPPALVPCTFEPGGTTAPPP